MRSKRMKRIRKVAPKQDHIPWITPPSQNLNVRQGRSTKTVTTHKLIFLFQQSQLTPTSSHPPFKNPVTAYMPEKSLPYLRHNVLQQCMNAIRSSNRTKTKMRKETKHTHKRKRYFSPITVPGTPPDTQIPDTTPTNKASTQTDEDDINLYCSIYNRYRPELDESNAESADRHLTIEREYLQLRKQKHNQSSTNNSDSRQPSNHTSQVTKQGVYNLTQGHHSLSPFKPIPSSIKFQLSRPASPIIEPMKLTNNAQDIILTSTNYLYTNPDQPLTPQEIDLIYDTGAAISTMPAEYSYAAMDGQISVSVYTLSRVVSQDHKNLTSKSASSMASLP
jgi:hypothetical protein